MDPYPSRVRRGSATPRILDFMNEHGQLADFLQARRGLLHPEDVGLQTYGERRRVPGLRREELAMLAGISAPYYTRLEQGQSRNASREVLDALATALRLDDSERAHLHELARAPKPGKAAPRPRPEYIRPATSALLAALEGTPAIVMGRRTDVLAWNTQGHALFAGHLDQGSPAEPGRRPNMAKLVFLDAHTRDLYTDWPAKARAVVGNLRLTAGRYPQDPLLAGLVGELTMRSPEFATMWADHKILTCDVADYEMHHPSVGTLTVTQQTLQSPQGSGPVVVIATATPGSPSATALKLLAHGATPGEEVSSRTDAGAGTHTT
ncbi:transcriptional regulator with XRE-family HTH domain [Streptomyces phaeochromogenes]|nr:transcriptional regulator with XRE-family HTH domain [Streptomyces phaeochromogenes]